MAVILQSPYDHSVSSVPRLKSTVGDICKRGSAFWTESLCTQKHNTNKIHLQNTSDYWLYIANQDWCTWDLLNDQAEYFSHFQLFCYQELKCKTQEHMPATRQCHASCSISKSFACLWCACGGAEWSWVQWVGVLLEEGKQHQILSFGGDGWECFSYIYFFTYSCKILSA